MRATLELGWQAYRRDSIDVAAARFGPAAKCGSAGGMVGLGFVELRRGRLDSADSLLRAALSHDSMLVDAWEGVARVA
ncbi:MAG TPA: hypothetical protein PK948_04015, partial [Gemmatimonadales bacterium]|nr:hypothetical protein [Gemmatimonadales bacterium]